MAPPTLHFGLLLLPGYQWLDAAGPVDYIDNHSYPMIKRLGVPQEVFDKAPVIEWHYISNNLELVYATSGPPQQPTKTYNDCPELDYLLIPGPSPTDPLPEGCTEFLQKRFADPKLKALLLVCTGSLAVSQTGILDGYHVSAGITSGLDLAAEFARKHFDKEIVELGRNVAEYESNTSHPDPFAFILDGIKLD
ncbi:class I glutamine amidotransferase-like protein [Gymnopilus junonius]|uniref:Class I glutamine amidotransferase-like protein n=1 Tax=Gymnopilus junonius TaxID=109634 RepID=A0A9P5NFD0_GYMJU|nr:class I glutamine amidotransferase-like protein [Gymnopilus junonius]